MNRAEIIQANDTMPTTEKRYMHIPTTIHVIVADVDKQNGSEVFIRFPKTETRRYLKRTFSLEEFKKQFTEVVITNIHEVTAL